MKEFLAIVGGGVVALFSTLIIAFVFVGTLNYFKANGLENLGYTTKVVAGDCYAKVDTRWITCDSATKDLNIKEVK